MARGRESSSFLQKGWLAVAKPIPPMDRRRDAQARGYDAESIKDGESCRGDAPDKSGVVSNHLSIRISPMRECAWSWLRLPMFLCSKDARSVEAKPCPIMRRSNWMDTRRRQQMGTDPALR